MRYQDNAVMMEGHNSASFSKDDDSKRPSFAEESDELQLEDVFNRSQGSLDSSSHGATEESLIRQFNASVGSKSLDRSVASFYLEMCHNDLHTAIGFFKEQNGDRGAQHEPVAKPYPAPPRPVARASSHYTPRRNHSSPKRNHSFDVAHRHGASSQRPRRIKSFDVAEAARVTAPSVNRSDHSRYPQQTTRAPPRPVPRNGNAQFSHRRATQCVPPSSRPRPVPRNSGGGAQFSHRRATQCVQLPDRRAAPWGRSKSERYFTDAKPQAAMLLPSSTHSNRGTSAARSLSPMRASPMRSSHEVLHSSLKEMDYSEAPSVTVSQPRSSRHQQARFSGWEPPTAKAGHHNPAA